MATSAFRSTTRRQSTPDSGTIRRSRSLSRRPEYEQNARNGKFLNTERGGGGGFSAASSFPEMSLDDLAIEFFSSSSFNDDDSHHNRNHTERVGRWAADTASSRRRGRSVSRTPLDTAPHVKQPLARRRRSLSTAPISVDSESEVDHSRISSNRYSVKTPTSGNKHASLLPNAKTSSNRQRGRSRSHRDTSVFHECYSSHSSAPTDEESKDACIFKNGSEKIIRTVYTRNKAEHPANDVANGGLYEAMRKELRYAVDEIRTELNHAVGRTHTTSATGQCFQSDTSNVPQDLNGIGDDCVPKLEKCKDDLTVRSNEECDLEDSRKVKDLPNSRFSSAAERHLRGRKRSTDRSKSTKRLIEEAERIIEDFISNVEDSDTSSFDGERSDCSSLGGVMKSRNAVTREAENFKIPAGSAFCTNELDGINLPWLQWETSSDCSLSGKNNVTPTALKRESEKAVVSLHDPSGYSVSSHGSWSPGLFNSPASKSEINRQSEQVRNTTSSFDMEEYLGLEKADKILFEMYIQRNRISSGGIFLCTGLL